MTDTSSPSTPPPNVPTISVTPPSPVLPPTSAWSLGGPIPEIPPFRPRPLKPPAYLAPPSTASRSLARYLVTHTPNLPSVTTSSASTSASTSSASTHNAHEGSSGNVPPPGTLQPPSTTSSPLHDTEGAAQAEAKVEDLLAAHINALLRRKAETPNERVYLYALARVVRLSKQLAQESVAAERGWQKWKKAAEEAQAKRESEHILAERRLKSQRSTVRRDLHEVRRQRDAARAEHDAAVRERDAAQRELAESGRELEKIVVLGERDPFALLVCWAGLWFSIVLEVFGFWICVLREAVRFLSRVVGRGY